MPLRSMLPLGMRICEWFLSVSWVCLHEETKRRYSAVLTGDASGMSSLGVVEQVSEPQNESLDDATLDDNLGYVATQPPATSTAPDALVSA